MAILTSVLFRIGKEQIIFDSINLSSILCFISCAIIPVARQLYLTQIQGANRPVSIDSDWVLVFAHQFFLNLNTKEGIRQRIRLLVITSTDKSCKDQRTCVQLRVQTPRLSAKVVFCVSVFFFCGNQASCKCLHANTGYPFFGSVCKSLGGIP